MVLQTSCRHNLVSTILSSQKLQNVLLTFDEIRISCCLSVHYMGRSWEAIYKVIPDEQPLIESTLKDLVSCSLCRSISYATKACS